MKNVKKVLMFFGAVIILVFLTSSASAFISVHCIVRFPDGKGEFWMPFEPVKCEDLNTGIVKTKLTNLIGNCRFFLLPWGHDYKIYMANYHDSGTSVVVHNYSRYAYITLLHHYYSYSLFPLINLRHVK